MLRTSLLTMTLVVGLLAVPDRAQAQSEPFIGQVMWTAATYCPRNWADANGQLLQINQFSALFSIMGTTYGGDGRTTFALPDLRGRVMIHTGTGPGLTTRTQGSRGGQENVTLSAAQMPQHTHNMRATTSRATTADPSGAQLAASGTYRQSGGAVNMAGQVAAAGGSQAHPNMQPYLTLRACIALQGVFPSRN